MAPVEQNNKIIRIGRKRPFLKILASVAALAALSLAAVVLITGKGQLSLDGVKRFFGGAGGEPKTAGFSYESGFNNVFADLNGGFAVASTVGVQVFDSGGNKKYTEIFEMSNPALISSGKLGAVYDLGGKSLKVFDTSGILGSLKTDGGIIAAALGRNGSLAVCKQESGGYKASVSFYRGGAYQFDKKPPFQWFSGDGYILSAALSPDEKRLAVLTLTGTGSRIVFFSLDSTTEKGSATLAGRLALDIRFTEDGRVMAVCKDALVAVSATGSNQVVTEYADKYLAAYSTGGAGFTAIALSNYMVGDLGKLVTASDEGKMIGTLETRRRIVSVSALGAYVAVLYGDGFSVYDRNLKECAHDDDTAGTLGAIMRSDGSALLVTPHSASVFGAVSG